jgi:tetratricopeptide (TPR) repeat protein
MPFEEYIRQNILIPLKMNQTSFIYPEIPDSLRVSGHIWSGRPQVSKVYPYNRIHAPSSTLNSNVLEMTHYAMANLNRGVFNGVRILSDSSYNTMWTNSIHLADKPTIGVSWFMDEHRGMTTIMHSGGDTGFGSFLLLVPEKNISVAVVRNYELGHTSDMALGVLDLLVGQEPNLVRLPIGFAFAEKMLADGLDSAKSFYQKTGKDTVQRKYYNWPDNGFTYAAYLLFNADKLPEAIELLKFNLELNPNSAPGNGHLGIGYAKSGNKEQARRYLQRALEIDATNSYFKEELQKLN